jgi:PhoH-like ATPase
MDNKTARLFVLDTNVLLHDPAALFRFHEHDLYVPMVVLEELDGAKKGTSEVARNARQVSRFLDEIVGGSESKDIERGLAITKLTRAPEDQGRSGRLFIQTRDFIQDLPAPLPGNKPDNDLLGIALALQHTDENRHVTLVSKDINLRIKARVLGVATEDYYNDKVLDELDVLYTGDTALPPELQIPDYPSVASDLGGHSHGQGDGGGDSDGGSYCLLTRGPDTARHFPNECLYQETTDFEAIVTRVDEAGVLVRKAADYRSPDYQVWGLQARNREQNFALNLLMDPQVEFVTLLGTAGTGKTLLTLAAGLEQTMDVRRYREIVMTRATIPVAEDIGFLPGTEEEKMTPWMGALLDNLEVLTQVETGGSWGRAATDDLLQKRIKIRSLNFMRGRTFLNRFVIIDEAQNLTPKQMKTLITRAGPGTKLVCLGNLSQIDSPYLSETSSGLAYVVERFKSWEHSGHIVLRRGERSALADFASENL